MRALTAVAPHPQLVSLLDVDDSFARDIPMSERALARRALMLPVTTLDRGPWPGPAATGAGTTTPWMLVLDGLLATEATVGRRPVVHLLGPGDLVVPPPADADAVLADCGATLCVETPATVMLLEDRFAAAGRAWPCLWTELQDRLAVQYRRLLAQTAILALPNVQDRIVAILRSLAQVCGRVRRDGVLIPLRLTHTRLGEMTAARRPTVSLALRDLASAGVVVRLPEGWLLTADAHAPGAIAPRAAPELAVQAATA